MKVREVELWHVAAPLDATFRPAWIPRYPMTHHHFTLLRVTTSDGLQGVAAGAAFGREREGLGQVVGPYLVGMDALDLGTVRQRLKELSYLGWHNRWMEAAFWDLKGKAEGAPVWRLLAGDDHEAPDAVDVYCSTGERRSPEEAAERAEQMVEEGFSAIKLRVHAPNLEEDVAVVEAARDAVGADVDLMVDANQGWRVDLFGGAPKWDRDRALAFAKEVAPLDVAWLEEPLDMHAVDDLAALRKDSPVPIAGAELLTGWPPLERCLKAGALDIYQPDCTFSGITAARRTLEACVDEGLGFAPHTWTNGVGLAANLHVHASHPDPGRLEWPYDPPGWTPKGRDVALVEPFRLDGDGRLPVPDRPGLGVEVDDGALARVGERFYRGTPLGVAVGTARSKGLGAFWEIVKAKLGGGGGDDAGDGGGDGAEEP